MLQDVAEVRIIDGPPMIRSEDARLNGRVYVTLSGRDLGSYIADARKAVNEQVDLPSGYTLTWAGQYEYLQRAQERLSWIIPLTLAIILGLLYLSFRNFTQALLVMVAVPLSLVGGSGWCTGWATRCRSRLSWVFLRLPVSPPSLAWS